MRGVVTGLGALAGLVLSGLAAPALAQTASGPDWEACRAWDHPQRISACTRLINGGGLSDSDRAQLHDWRSAARVEARDYAGAVADADRYAELTPGSARGAVIRCLTRAMAGLELEVADQACGEALALSEEISFYTARGFLRLRQNRNAEAWADFNRVVTQDDGTSEQPLYGRGVAALRLGRAEQGRADIAAAIMIDPGVGQRFADWGVRPPAPTPASAAARPAAQAPVVAPVVAPPAPPRPQAPPPSAPRAPSQASVITNPDWVARPRVDFSDGLMRRLDNAGITSATVILQCTVRVSGHLSDCVAVSDTAPGYGMAEEAISSVIRSARIRPRLVDGQPEEGTVRIPVSLRL